MNDAPLDPMEQRLRDYFAQVAQVARPYHPPALPQIINRSDEVEHAEPPMVAALVPHAPARPITLVPLKGDRIMIPKNPPRSRRSLFPIAATLLALLSITSVVLFNAVHTGHSGSPVASSHIPSPTPTPIGSAMDKGITLTVATASLTALATDLTFTLSPDHDPLDLVISDDRGFSSFCNGSSSVIGTTNGYANQAHCDAFPLAELGQPVRLTVTVSRLGSRRNLDDAVITGLWQVTATVPSTAPTQLIANTPAITHHGIVIQPTVAVITKKSSQTGARSGITVQLHIDARASSYPLCGMEFVYQSLDYATKGGASVSPGPTSSLATLTLPNASSQTPTFAPSSYYEYCPSLHGLPYLTNSNVVDEWLTWEQPLTRLPDHITLTVQSLAVSIGTSFNDNRHTTITGPWTFSIPLH